jgi:hypothetical protein
MHTSAEVYKADGAEILNTFFTHSQFPEQSRFTRENINQNRYTMF